jgi:hypothetical protein
LFIVLLAGIACVVLTRRAGTEWRAAIACVFCLLLGLSFYIYLHVASMTNPPANWGYARTVEGFFHVLSRGQFERPNPTSEFPRYLMQLWLYFVTAAKELGWPQLILSIVPFFFLHRMSPRGRRVFICLLTVWLGVGPLMVAQLNPPPDRQAIELITWFYQCSYVILAIWFGFGLTILGAVMSKPLKTTESISSPHQSIGRSSATL